MKRHKFDEGFNPVYPLVPLFPEERKSIEDGGGGALERFRSRMEAVKIQDIFLPDYTKVAEHLFFKGGKLSDFGLRPREEVDEQVAFDVICAMLRSPFPNHIQREATVGLAIYNWYEEGIRKEGEEPEFPIFFRNPREHKLGYAGFKLLTGKNRN